MVEGFLTFLTYLEAMINPGNALGLLALFGVAAITDIGIPVPFLLETVLLLSAYHSGVFSMQVILIVITLFLGRLVGSTILYFLSWFLGNIFLNWIARHFPSISKRMDMRHIHNSRWVSLTIAAARLTPGLGQTTSIASGAIRLRYYHFLLGVIIASAVYDGVMILLGFIASINPRADDINFTMWSIIAIIIVLSIVWPLIFILIRRDRKNGSRSCDSAH